IISDGFTQFDVTAGTDLTEKLYLGLNATSASDNFEGVAAYFQLATSEALKVGLRAEYFKDKGVGVLNTGESVMDLTFSANYTVGSLTIIPEIRIDNLSYEGYMTEPTVQTFNSKSLSSFVLATVFTF
ncbi:MAG TPA: outer membrane beta-barrel protein, partial [Roseivirga sp.]